VVVCPAEAARNNPDLEGELRLLVTHGVLHLLGYDHEDEEARAAMWSRQDRYVKEIST
jgi:probable rRNA maturation factor